MKKRRCTRSVTWIRSTNFLFNRSEYKYVHYFSHRQRNNEINQEEINWTKYILLFRYLNERLHCIQSHSSLALFVMIVFTAVVLWFIWNLWCFMHSSSLYNLLYWRYSVFLFVHFYISFFLFLNSKKSCENCDLFNQLKNKTRKRNTELKDYVNWSRKSEQIKKKKDEKKNNQDIDYGKRILFNAKL